MVSPGISSCFLFCLFVLSIFAHLSRFDKHAYLLSFQKLTLIIGGKQSRLGENKTNPTGTDF